MISSISANGGGGATLTPSIAVRTVSVTSSSISSGLLRVALERVPVAVLLTEEELSRGSFDLVAAV